MTELNTAHLSDQHLASPVSSSRRKLKPSNLQSLEKVDATTLPAKVLVLLSKYAIALKNHNGTVIQLSSLNVFRHVHHTSLLCKDPIAQKIHRQLMVQVCSHIKLGSMYVIGQKATEKTVQSRNSILGNRQQVALDLLVMKSPYNKASNSIKHSLRPSDVELSI